MKSPLMLIFLTVFIDLVGFGLIVPILPTFARQYHCDAFMVGFVLSIYSIMQFIFLPFWGKLSDAKGRKPVLLVSLFFSMLGYLVWGFSNSIWLLLLARAVAGFGNANIAVAQAYVTDVTTAENRSKGMGAIGAAFGLGFVLGPAIGGMLSGFSLAHVGFVAAALSALDLVLTFFMLPEPQNRSNAATQRFDLSLDFIIKTLTDPKLKDSILIFFLSTLAFANMEATLVLLTKDRFQFDTKANSILFTFVGLVIVFVQGGMVHRFVKKYGEKILIIFGCILLCIALLSISLANNVTLLYSAVGLLALGSGLNTPSNQSLLSKLAPSENSGAVLGVGQSMSTLGRIFGPLMGGYLYDKFNMNAPYFAASLIMVIAILLAVKLPSLKPVTSSK